MQTEFKNSGERIAMQHFVSISLTFIHNFISLILFCMAFLFVQWVFQDFPLVCYETAMHSSSWIMPWTTTPLGQRRRGWWWIETELRTEMQVSFGITITFPCQWYDCSRFKYIVSCSRNKRTKMAKQAVEHCWKNKLHLRFIHDHIAISYLLALNLFHFVAGFFAWGAKQAFAII